MTVVPLAEDSAPLLATKPAPAAVEIEPMPDDEAIADMVLETAAVSISASSSVSSPDWLGGEASDWKNALPLPVWPLVSSAPAAPLIAYAERQDA